MGPCDAVAVGAAGEGDVMNVHETLLAAQIAQAGLPKPSRQYPYAKPRRFRADFAWPLYALLVEVTGGVWNRRAHGSITGVLADIDRLNEATRHRWRMLRFTPDAVDDGSALALLREVLAQAALAEKEA